MNRVWTAGGFLVAAALVSVSPAQAVDQLIPGKIHIVKSTLVKMVAKPAGTFLVPTGGGADDPSQNGGGLEVIDTGDSSATFTTTLPSQQWKALGNPPGSSGYKYKGAGTLADPCKVVLVKSTVIKFVCKDDQTLNPPFVGASGITLSLGGQNYCAEFGGTPVKNDPGLLKRKDAAAPGACPVPPTCCSLPSDPMTSASFHGFTAADAPGTCGSYTDVLGMTTDLGCSGLYFGGGGNSVPLPASVPDLSTNITQITSCVGQTATLDATTSAQTGSISTCTAAGCFFAAPLAVPNSSSTPTSTCVLVQIASNAMGTLDCMTGAETLSLPLGAIVYLTGDGAADPMGIVPGIQACPLCEGGTCIGGLNNGMACTPGTSDLDGGVGGDYPTSLDCPPDPMFDIGTLPVSFALTTDTVSWTATTATNDDGTEPNDARIFSGFCRDANVSGLFQNPAKHCWENGMAVLSACAGSFETCEQRNLGAFGPGGGGSMTITENGTPQAGITSGPAAGTLVSVFSIPPTFNPTVDAAGDLPGPGAVSLPGTGTLCADAMSCP